MTKIMMIVMAMTMSSCCASPSEVSGGKAASNQDETVKQVMLPVHFVHEGEHEQIPVTSAKEFKSQPTVPWTCFNVVIFTSIIGAMGFAAWKFLPRKE